MGIFLKTTYESRYAGTFENNVKQIKVLNYITDNLNNVVWQESIAGQLRNLDEQYNHQTLFIVLRLFHLKDIEEGKLKSYARYMKRKDCLDIDQMFVLDNFTDLAEDEMRIKLCDELFDYVEKILIKYKDRFQDFDAIAFIPLLEQQMKKIKNAEFEDDFYETESYSMLKQVEEIKKY